MMSADSKGRRVYDASQEVSFAVTGAATLLAVDNGDHYTDLLFTPDVTRKPLHRGFCQCILRSARTPGAVSVSVTAPGLKAAKLTLPTR